VQRNCFKFSCCKLRESNNLEANLKHKDMQIPKTSYNKTFLFNLSLKDGQSHHLKLRYELSKLKVVQECRTLCEIKLKYTLDTGGIMVGTTLANLQIRKLSVNEAEQIFAGSLIKEFSSGWITVTSEHFEAGNMQETARRVSKKIENAVLSVEIFDDDLLIISIFRKGKTVASYISGTEYGYIKKQGNPASFVKELELPETCIEYLRWIFKYDDIGKKIELIERIIGIPLRIDYRVMLDLQIEYDSICRDLVYVENYIKEKKSSEKIKNATKVKLLLEFDGKIYKGLDSNMFLVHEPSVDGNYYEFMNHYIYSVSPNGVVENLFDISSFHVNRYNKHFIANNNVIGILSNNVVREKVTFWLLDIKGNLIGESRLPGEVGYPLLLFEDGGIILCSYGRSQILCEYDINGLKRWELDAGYLDVKPMLHDGYIYLYYTNQDCNKSELLKMDRNGIKIASLNLKLFGGAHWETFQFDRKGNFYFCLRTNDNEKVSNKLLYIDSNLNIISEVILSGASFEGVLDNENNRLYISIFEEELLIVDTEENFICARRKHEETSTLYSTDAKGRLVVRRGLSTIEIFDYNLNITSRHRLKGILTHQYKNLNGDTFVITEQMPEDSYVTDNVKSTIRIYEIFY
jgi:hypothetical protein